MNESMTNTKPHSQTRGVVENQQVRGLGWQRCEDIWGGQGEKRLLELVWGQHGKGDRGNGLQDGRGKHRRHPRGESSTGEGEDGTESALRNGLDDRRGNKSRNIRIERLGWVEREEVGEKTGGMGRSHRGSRDSVGGGRSSGPGGKDVQT